eukprot:gene6899-11061_t
MGQKDSVKKGFKFEQGKDSKIEYIKSFSSSELTVGNRMVISIVNDKGSKDIEKGSLKIVNHFKLETLKELIEEIEKNEFTSITTKKSKMVTSGSDIGQSIIISCGEERKEVRLSERGGLTTKEQERFISVETFLLKLVDDTLAKNSIKVKVTLNQNLFELYKDDFPFAISVNNEKFLILNGDLEQKSIEDDVYISQSNDFLIKPYSVLGDEDEDVDKKLILRFEEDLSIANEDHLNFDVVDGQLKITKL